MDMTLAEFAEILEPAMTVSQLATLTILADIQPSGRRRTGKPGRPANTYDTASIMQAHGEETRRTAKQFTDCDWIASALIGRHLVVVNPAAGEIRWPDGERAEKLSHDYYGYVHVGRQRTAAHRIIWIATEGEIPPLIQINHMNHLHWDNRRANLELVTFAHNIRHAHGKSGYLNYHDAVSELATLPPQPETISPYGGNFQGGRLLAGKNKHRHGRQ